MPDPTTHPLYTWQPHICRDCAQKADEEAREGSADTGSAYCEHSQTLVFWCRPLIGTLRLHSGRPLTRAQAAQHLAAIEAAAFLDQSAQGAEH